MLGYYRIRSFGNNARSRSWAYDRCIYEVSTFQHTSETGLKIDVIVSRTPFVTDVISLFHSSHVMNLATSQYLVVMFPCHTLHSQSLSSKRRNPISNQNALKYMARGISLRYDNLGLSKPCGAACPAVLRGRSRPRTYLNVPLVMSAVGSECPLLPHTPWRAPVRCVNQFCPHNERVRQIDTTVRVLIFYIRTSTKILQM